MDPAGQVVATNVVKIAPDSIPDFEMFYTIFPRHEARKDALKAWNQMSPSDQIRAIISIASWRRVFLDRGLQYTPLPATWLRGERFDDELPAEYRASHLSHCIATIEPQDRSGTIPDHVRALFAKLKAKS